MPSDRRLADFFGEPIFSYTRAQAIKDGVLVDVTATARQAGFLVPVALTQAVWEDCVAWSAEDSQRQTLQDEAGRLWDVLCHARFRIKSAPPNAAGELRYRLLRVPRGGTETRPISVDLKMMSSVGDDHEHVITIMLPNED